MKVVQKAPSEAPGSFEAGHLYKFTGLGEHSGQLYFCSVRGGTTQLASVVTGKGFGTSSATASYIDVTDSYALKEEG